MVKSRISISPRIALLVAGIIAHAFVSCLGAGGAEDSVSIWPSLHRDYQRSGHTDDLVRGPYRRKWWRDFHDEMIATRCEAIVAEGKVFVGTFAGNVYALDVADGRTLWRFQADGPVGASPCYRDGRLYVGSDDAFNRGTLHCLRAATGELLWRYATPGGVWASPACDGRQVYVGDRAGVFHAVGAADGTRAWALKTGYMILKPASFSVDGQKIVFGSDDMHVYCVSPEGSLLWKTPKLPGLSLRDQGATIWKGLAIVRTNPADGFHEVLGRNGETLEAIQRAIPMTDDDAVLLEKWGDLLLAPRPERRRAEIQGVVEYLKANRHDQCFFAFDLADGSEPWVAPVFYTCGLHNPPTQPTFSPHSGELYTLSRSALTYYVRGVRRYSCLVRLDRETGRPDWHWPERQERKWRAFPMIPDETQALGMMGDLVVGTHQGVLGAVDPRTGDAFPIWPGRDTYAGIFGPGAVPGTFEGAKRLAREGYLTGMPNEWHGPDRAIAAIAAGRMFWIAGSQVVCVAGPDVPKTATGGTEPPDPFRMRLPEIVPGGNVANRGQGRVDRFLTMRKIRADELRDFLPGPSSRPAPDGPAAALRDRLDMEVRELIQGDSGQPWAPFVVQLGISREERHFWRTSDTIRIVSLALPHLSPEVQAAATAYLDRLFEAGCPLDEPVHPPEGARREPFDLGPKMKQFAAAAPRYRAGVDGLYALWAYAHFADRRQAVQARMDKITNVFDRFAADVPAFDPNDMERDAAQRLNARIAGVLAAARIFDRAADADRRDKALALLADLVTLRVHHERSDHRLVRPTKGDSGGIHQAKVPRYVDLVPELSGMLRRFTGAELKEHVTGLRRALPLWYQAYGERMIGGENYISPPHLAHGVFTIWADGCGAAPKDLVAKLDQPWCKADLYYIEKLSAVLRRLDTHAL
jgi:outer membrane protein assembly factor BamB